jgi:hypothetical protein
VGWCSVGLPPRCCAGCFDLVRFDGDKVVSGGFPPVGARFFALILMEMRGDRLMAVGFVLSFT